LQVILRTDVEKVGLRGDVVNVARGYARNFLLPRGLAEEATPARVAEAQKREAQRARHEAQTFDQAREMADALGETVLRFDVKAGPTGSLFGSVTPTDIVDEIWKLKKIRVDRRKVGIDNIKRIGRYTVPIELFNDVDVEVSTLVVPEGGELPPEEELEAMEAAERAKEEEAAAAAAAQHEELEELVAEAEVVEEAAEEPTAETESPAEPAAEDEAPPTE
jgi:large subunit ribosomal protein L9